MPKGLKASYDAWRKFLRIDTKLGPRRSRSVMRGFHKTALPFKSQALKYDLSTHKDFKGQWKRANKGIAARSTGALVRSGGTITSFFSGRTYIDIAYRRKGIRKVVRFSSGSGVGFMKYLPSNYMINIDGTAYNKSLPDFLFDWANMSINFYSKIAPSVLNGSYSIYAW